MIEANPRLEQEDPFKLVIVAKEVNRLGIMTADFLFASDGAFYIAVSDEEGVIRLLEYDPEGRDLLTPSCLMFHLAFFICFYRPGISKRAVPSTTNGIPCPD